MKESDAKNFRFAPLAVAPYAGVDFGVAGVGVVAVPLSETSDLLLYFVVTMQKEFKEFF